jgi:hypothetical protein
MGLRLAWACRRTRRDLKVDHRAVRKFVDSELSLKKSWRPASTIAPNIATRRVQRRKYQDHIKPERPGFIDETWTVIADNPGSCKAMRQLIRVAGVKLPAQNMRRTCTRSSRHSPTLVAQGAAHFIETICAASAQVLTAFTRGEWCKLFLNFSGYA